LKRGEKSYTVSFSKKGVQERTVRAKAWVSTQNPTWRRGERRRRKKKPLWLKNRKGALSAYGEWK